MCDEHRMTLASPLSCPNTSVLTHKECPVLAWLDDVPVTSSDSHLSPAATPPLTSDIIAPGPINHNITHDTASLVTTTNGRATQQDIDGSLSDRAVECSDDDHHTVPSPAHLNSYVRSEICRVVDRENFLLFTEILAQIQLSKDLRRLRASQRQLHAIQRHLCASQKQLGASRGWLAKARSDVENMQRDANCVRAVAVKHGLQSTYNDITHRRNRAFAATPYFRQISHIVAKYCRAASRPAMPGSDVHTRIQF